MSGNSKYKTITDQEFEQRILEEPSLSVLVFGADWSGNSEILDSMMERISEEFETDVHFFKVDIEKHNSIAEFFNVLTVPTILIIINGEVVDLIRGLIPAAKIREKLNKYISESK